MLLAFGISFFFWKTTINIFLWHTNMSPCAAVWLNDDVFFLLVFLGGHFRCRETGEIRREKEGVTCNNFSQSWTRNMSSNHLATSAHQWWVFNSIRVYGTDKWAKIRFGFTEVITVGFNLFVGSQIYPLFSRCWPSDRLAVLHWTRTRQK